MKIINKIMMMILVISSTLTHGSAPKYRVKPADSKIALEHLPSPAAAAAPLPRIQVPIPGAVIDRDYADQCISKPPASTFPSFKPEFCTDLKACSDDAKRSLEPDNSLINKIIPGFDRIPLEAQKLIFQYFQYSDMYPLLFKARPESIASPILHDLGLGIRSIAFCNPLSSSDDIIVAHSSYSLYFLLPSNERIRVMPGFGEIKRTILNATRDHIMTTDDTSVTVNQIHLAKSDNSKPTIKLTSIAKFKSSENITHAQFTTSGTPLIALATEKSAINLYDLAGKMITTLQHTGPVNSIKFNSSGLRLLSASEDGTCSLWTREGKKEWTFHHPTAAPIISASFLDQDHRILITTRDQKAHIIDMDAQPEKLIATFDNALLMPQIHGEKRLIVTIYRQRISVRDFEGTIINERLLPYEPKYIISLLINDDGNTITVATDRYITLLNTHDHDEFTVGSKSCDYIAENRFDIEWAAVSPHGSKLAAIDHNGRVPIWPIAKLLMSLKSYSPDQIALLLMFQANAKKLRLKALAQKYGVSYEKIIETLASFDPEYRKEITTYYPFAVKDATPTAAPASSGSVAITIAPAPPAAAPAAGAAPLPILVDTTPSCISARTAKQLASVLCMIAMITTGAYFGATKA